MAEGEELYKKYRPTKFSEVVGQKEAIATLQDMGKRNAIPHTLLFTGPSGCGKTTLARILRVKLKCSDHDFQELNASDCRGIDEVRNIRQKIGFAPMAGDCRVLLVDEVHGLTGDAQEAFLKLLEDTPKHIYFMLATTLPSKLKKTIITRCTEIRCKEISVADLEALVKRVSEAEGKTLDVEVITKIAEVAEGSARKALVLLHAVIGLPDKDSQLAAVQAGDVKGQATAISNLLLKEGTTWRDVAKILENIDEEPETVRRMILGYCSAVLLRSGSARAAMIIEEFRSPLYDVGKPGLVQSCFNIIKG